MNFQNPYWARKRVLELNPEIHAQEITHLSFEVRYASPIFTHSLFSIAFARQAAVPSIAKILYRDGKGEIIRNTRKRNNDTLLFFGEFFKNGISPHGKEIIAKLNKIHSHFPITNEQNIFTLGTLMCEPKRMSFFLTGRNVFNEKENRAVFNFWKMIGEEMLIKDIPEDEDKMYESYIHFAEKKFEFSEDGRAIVEALADEFAERWYPKWMKDFGRAVYFSLFDDFMLQTFRIKKLNVLIRFSVLFYLRFFLTVWVKIMPDPSDRSIIEIFSKDYESYNIGRVGPELK